MAEALKLKSQDTGIPANKRPRGRENFAITGTPTPIWKDDAMAFLGTLTDAPLVQVLEVSAQ